MLSGLSSPIGGASTVTGGAGPAAFARSVVARWCGRRVARAPLDLTLRRATAPAAVVFGERVYARTVQIAPRLSLHLTALLRPQAPPVFR